MYYIIKYQVMMMVSTSKCRLAMVTIIIGLKTRLFVCMQASLLLHV